MLKYNFERIFKARGIEKPFTFLRNAGFTELHSKNIKRGKLSRVNLSTLERICITMRCTPNDIIEWIPDEKFDVDREHPIYKIIRRQKEIDINKLLNSIPLDKIDEIEKMIIKKVEE